MYLTRGTTHTYYLKALKPSAHLLFILKPNSFAFRLQPFLVSIDFTWLWNRNNDTTINRSSGQPSMASMQPETLHISDTRGTKRPKVEDKVDTPQEPLHHVHELLTPRIASRCATPDVNPNQNELLYYDDECHEDVEWIRLPKKRDYDLFRVAKRKPEDVDVIKAELPLTTVNHEGKDVTLWAKMDTGSDINTINRTTVNALLGHSAHRLMRAMTEDDKCNLIGGKTFDAHYTINLSFSAGLSKKQFNDIKFIVVEDGTDTDGVPNALLGYDHLWKYSMFQIDLEYCHDADPSLPVLADRAENEKGGIAGPLPVILLPQRPGVPRPMR